MRLKFSVEPDFVLPKIEDDSNRISSLFSDAFGDLLSDSDFRVSTEPDDSPEETSSGELVWKEWSLGIDLSAYESIAEDSQKVLESLDAISQVLVIVLKILRIFSNSLKSLTGGLKVIIKMAVKTITQTIESLSSIGGYATAIIPDFDERSSIFQFPINGGFQEFKSRVSASCLSTTDPNAPKFGPKDLVGGWVIAMGSGVNDPELLADMVKNFEILAKFFGFKNPMPSPPRNFKATPGLYNEPGSATTDKKLGVKLTWEHPGTPVSGFQLSRSKNYKGSITKEIIEGKSVNVMKYANEDFNEESPVEFKVIPGKLKYSYIDFEVEDNQPYYYIVHSTAGFEFFREGGFFERVSSPIATQPVGVIPRNCIPISELQKYLTLDEDGNPVDPSNLESEWVVVTVRSLLGNQMDQLLNLLDKTANKLLGIVATPSDAINDYIQFYEQRIRGYMNTVNKISNIIQRISSYKLQGSVLLLDVPIEAGGIEGFVNRFNSAEIDPQFVNTGQGRQTAGVSSNVGDLEGIFAGVVIIWGFPSLEGKGIDYLVPPEDRDNFASEIEKSQEAIETIKSLLGLS